MVQALVDLPLRYACGITIFPRIFPLLPLFQTLVCPDNVKYNLLRPLLGCVKPIPFPSCSWDQTLQTATKPASQGLEHAIIQKRTNIQNGQFRALVRVHKVCLPAHSSLMLLRTVNSTLSCAKCTFFLHITLTDITIYLDSLPDKCYAYIPWIHTSNTPLAPGLSASINKRHTLVT